MLLHRRSIRFFWAQRTYVHLPKKSQIASKASDISIVWHRAFNAMLDLKTLSQTRQPRNDASNLTSIVLTRENAYQIPEIQSDEGRVEITE